MTNPAARRTRSPRLSPALPAAAVDTDHPALRAGGGSSRPLLRALAAAGERLLRSRQLGGLAALGAGGLGRRGLTLVQVAALLDARRLARQVPQVEEAGLVDLATGHDLDAVDVRRV